MRYILFFLMITTSSCGLFTSEDEEYSPEIVFSAEDKKGTPQIYTMNDDGSNIRRITNFGSSDGGVEPSWSPNGKSIVFSTTLQSTSNGLSLFIMNADGSDLRPMNERVGSDVPTPGNHAKWSPDGSKIVFQSCVACQVGTNIELFIYDFEGDSVIQLTDTEYGISNTNPVWSPDGTRIAFITNRDYVNADSLPFRKDLYVLNSDGSDSQRITESGFPGNYEWVNTSSIIYAGRTSLDDRKSIFQINLETGELNTIWEDNEMMDLLWVFYTSEHNQFVTLNKNHTQLPLEITFRKNDGDLIQHFELNSEKLKTALSFDFQRNSK